MLTKSRLLLGAQLIVKYFYSLLMQNLTLIRDLVNQLDIYNCWHEIYINYRSDFL
jgi:hypothetical protein